MRARDKRPNTLVDIKFRIARIRQQSGGERQRGRAREILSYNLCQHATGTGYETGSLRILGDGWRWWDG